MLLCLIAKPKHNLQKKFRALKNASQLTEGSQFSTSRSVTAQSPLSQFLPRWEVNQLSWRELRSQLRFWGQVAWSPHLRSLEIEVETFPRCCKHIQSLCSLASCWRQPPSPKNKTLTSAKSHFGNYWHTQAFLLLKHALKAAQRFGDGENEEFTKDGKEIRDLGLICTTSKWEINGEQRKMGKGNNPYTRRQ